MTKYLTAKQKAEELGITTRGLAKTRHLYKHIKKSPRKYLYFKEEAREVVRPSGVGSSVGSVTPKSPPRSHKRREVPFGEENYHKCPGGSGHSLQRLNQLRSKLAYEGKHTDEEIKSMDQALAIKIKDNHKEIVEKKQKELQIKISLEDERARKADPRRYGHFTPLGSLITFSTNWNEIFPKEKDEYERALEELGENSSEYEYY